MIIKENKFAGEKGFLFVHKLLISNYVDREKIFVVPCFITKDGYYNSRISKYFGDMPVQAGDLIEIDGDCNFEGILSEGRRIGEQLAEEIFYEQKLLIEEKIHKQKVSRDAYYKAQEKAVMRIAVDNIRQARMKELENEKEEFRLQSRKRRQMIPSLSCEQIAYVEFV